LITVEFNEETSVVRFQQCLQVYAFRFRVGQTVPKLYNPARPDQAMIDSFWRVWSIWGYSHPSASYCALVHSQSDPSLRK